MTSHGISTSNGRDLTVERLNAPTLSSRALSATAMIPPASPSCLWASRDMKTSKRTPPGTPKYHRLTSEKRIIIWMLKKEGKIAVKAAKRRATIAHLTRNESVSMDVLIRICDILKCNVGDIMDVVLEDHENTH